MILKRVFAFAIDYFIILIYVAILIFVSLSIQKALQIQGDQMSPYSGQIIGFITLTLPVFLYFFLAEKGKHQATVGKRFMKIKVKGLQVSNSSIFKRNIIKFLPWEIAHAGIHWLFYSIRLEVNVPIWVWVLLVLPQIAILLYFVSIVLSKGRSSIYDKIAKTRIITN